MMSHESQMTSRGTDSHYDVTQYLMHLVVAAGTMGPKKETTKDRMDRQGLRCKAGKAKEARPKRQGQRGKAKEARPKRQGLSLWSDKGVNVHLVMD